MIRGMAKEKGGTRGRQLMAMEKEIGWGELAHER
jgi:hypothetical protein